LCFNNSKEAQKCYCEALNCRGWIGETPEEEKEKIEKKETRERDTKKKKEEMQEKPYKELVGSLIYLANATRPDIAFISNVLSRYYSNPQQKHWIAAKRVIRYLKETIDYCITYEADGKPMQTFVDSDWAGDVSDRKSCSGFITILAGGPVSWSSKKQKTVALSTMEAEYMAISEAVREIIFIKRLLKFMLFSNYVKDPVTLHRDNQSAILMCKNPVFHGRSKHIDIRHHYVRELVEAREINVEYLKTEDMVADLLTKALPKIKHVNYTKMLNMF